LEPNDPKIQVRLDPALHEELLTIAGERAMSPVALAREMIQSAVQRPVQEQRQAGPSAASQSVLFLALQPRLLGRLG
jgi:hypothetical protein